MLQEVEALLNEADNVYGKDISRAKDYVKKARRKAMKIRLRLPAEIKRHFCKHCDAYHRQGKNVRTRISKGKVVIYCLECKKFTRIPLKRKNKSQETTK